MNKEEKNKSKKKTLKTIRRIIILLIFLGITLSTFPSIEYDNAYNHYKNNLPKIELQENKKEYISRLYEEALNSNNRLSQEEKEKLKNVFTSLVIEEIGDYFTEETIIQMMAIASTESIKELTKIEKRFSWYTGFYNDYLNQLVLNSSIKDVDDTLLAHEQLHAILKNSFYTKSYALNEAMTKNSVKGDESYIYLNQLYNVLCFTIGKEKLYNSYLTGDIDSLKNEFNHFLSAEDTNRLLIAYDDIVFSHFYTSFLYNIGLSPSFNTLKKRETAENTTQELLTKLFEKRFNCNLENSFIGKVIFGYYTPKISGLTFINNKVGYYEPYFTVTYLNESKCKINIEFITSNIDPSTKDFYRISESYLVDLEDIGSLDINTFIEDAKSKHQKELIERPYKKSIQ